MHPVAQLIHARLRGETDNAKLAIVAEASGQKWIVLIAMAARLEAHGIDAEIMGGTSGGALIMLYLSQHQASLGVLNVNHLSNRGYAGNASRQFISLKHLLSFKPVMDINGSIDEVLTTHVPLQWQGFKSLKKPFFVTTTRDNGEATIKRLDGQSVKACKDWAKTTARIPLIGGWLGHYQEWDGGLTAPLPLEQALVLGATHILVLRCKTDEVLIIEKFFLWPVLRLFKPCLAKLLKTRYQHLSETEEKYAESPNVLMVSIEGLTLSSTCTDEREMMEHALKGWHAAGETLQLPPLPYPVLWRPTMERLGLAEGAEFA